MKRVVVVVSGATDGRSLREAEIQPGTTAADVLVALDLRGFLLSREGSGQIFAEEEPIFDAIVDGDKLRATPVAKVGNASRRNHNE